MDGMNNTENQKLDQDGEQKTPTPMEQEQERKVVKRQSTNRWVKQIIVWKQYAHAAQVYQLGEF